MRLLNNGQKFGTSLFLEYIRKMAALLMIPWPFEIVEMGVNMIF